MKLRWSGSLNKTGRRSGNTVSWRLQGEEKNIKSIVKNCFDVFLLHTYVETRKKSQIAFTNIHTHESRVFASKVLYVSLVKLRLIDDCHFHRGKHIMLKIFGELSEVKSISHITERKYLCLFFRALLA
jgi:hypothetical protein